MTDNQLLDLLSQTFERKLPIDGELKKLSLFDELIEGPLHVYRDAQTVIASDCLFLDVTEDNPLILLNTQARQTEFHGGCLVFKSRFNCGNETGYSIIASGTVIQTCELDDFRVAEDCRMLRTNMQRFRIGKSVEVANCHFPLSSRYNHTYLDDKVVLHDATIPDSTSNYELLNGDWRHFPPMCLITYPYIVRQTGIDSVSIGCFNYTFDQWRDQNDPQIALEINRFKLKGTKQMYQDILNLIETRTKEALAEGFLKMTD